MEIQWKDNEILAAYIHHFKTAAKWCTFHNDTVGIHFFVKALQDAHTTVVKINEKDPQTLAEVIRNVEQLNAAQQLTAMLTPSTVSMMSNDDRCFVVDGSVILAINALMYSVMAVMNLATLHGTFPTRFLPQEHHATKTDLI